MTNANVLVLNPFKLDPDAHSDAHGLFCPEPTLTVQADKESSDINNIVKQFGLTQMLPYGNSVPEYTDFTDAPMDFHSAQNFIIEARSEFMKYPAHIRAAFDNDPGVFLQSLEDPTKAQLFQDLGLSLPKDAAPPPSDFQEPPTAEPEGD